MKQHYKYALLIFIAGSSYGFMIPTVKLGLDAGFSSIQCTPLQYIFGFLICMTYALIKRYEFPPLRSCIKIAFIGLCTSLTSILYYYSAAELTGAFAVTLLFQYVWINVLIECIVKRHLPSRSTVISVIIVIAGSILSSGVLEKPLDHFSILGILGGFASAFLYSLFLYTSGKVEVDKQPAVRSALLPIGGIITTCVCTMDTLPSTLTNIEAMPFGLVLAVLGLVVPTVLINYASPHLSPGYVSIMASSELPAGIFLTWLIIGEVASVMSWIGVALVLFGIILKNIFEKKNMQMPIEEDGK